MIPVYLGFAVFYLTSVLLFSMDDTGPYPQKNKDIAHGALDPETKERILIKRPVGLFDYLRRFFGAYTVNKDSQDGREVWIVREARMAVWTCPYCLGFWVAFVLAVFFVIWYQDPQPFFINWFTAAGINRILSRES